MSELPTTFEGLKERFYHNYRILEPMPRGERLEHPLMRENDRIIKRLLEMFE
jgi:hypothetical protein